jgi:hypothetical protein
MMLDYSRDNFCRFWAGELAQHRRVNSVRDKAAQMNRNQVMIINRDDWHSRYTGGPTAGRRTCQGGGRVRHATPLLKPRQLYVDRLGTRILAFSPGATNAWTRPCGCSLGEENTTWRADGAIVPA